MQRSGGGQGERQNVGKAIITRYVKVYVHVHRCTISDLNCSQQYWPIC